MTLRKKGFPKMGRFRIASRSMRTDLGLTLQNPNRGTRASMHLSLTPIKGFKIEKYFKV